ncbi:MAG: hypothetical protein M3541_04990 [Acidobacteriota bacterium]|nr:hypothetical protein [Acidobacteriota bacterium]
MDEETIILTVFVLFVVAGVTLLLMAMSNRRYMRELAHRERMAMIERGLVPSPESDPAQFEAATGLATTPPPPSLPKRGDRFRTLGVAMIGLGFGLAFLIGLTGGDPDVGVGVGGAWVALGAASLLNYFLIRRDR